MAMPPEPGPIRPMLHATDHDPAESPTRIASLIEGEIIPRLLMAHRRGVPDIEVRPVSGPSHVTKRDIAILAELALDQEASTLITHVNGIIKRGVSPEAILVNYLGAAARLLGVQWDNDDISFIDVTMAVWRLQEVVHDLAARIPAAAIADEGAMRSLFSVMPGDNHGFGTIVVDECFRRNGWNSRCLTAVDEDQLLGIVAAEKYDLVGLTVSCDHHLTDLPRLIAAVRAASANPHLVIMLGGRLFNSSSDAALRIGADLSAPDAHAAVDLAQALVAEATARSAAVT
jgi:MerR family transcriptional regulator, light-induced transcriptional regulator